MLSLITEFFPSTSPIPLALSASAPAARRAVECSHCGFVVKGVTSQLELVSQDAELSSFLRPLRTLSIHTETLPPAFHSMLWWVCRGGAAAAPVAFQGTRLVGSLRFGIPRAHSGGRAEGAELSDVPLRFATHCISVVMAGSRLKELHLNPSALSKLERLDVSRCRRLRGLGWCPTMPNTTTPQVLSVLKVMKASYSALASLPSAALPEWAPVVTSVRFDGCRELTASQINNLLEGATKLADAHLGDTLLTSIDVIATTCPCVVGLNVSNCKALCDVRAVEKLRWLRSLDLHGNSGLTSLQGVGHCQRLRTLNISLCTGIITLAPLAEEGGLRELRHFNASNCTALCDTDVEVLKPCADLRSVKMDWCRALTDLSGLSQHTTLTHLSVNDTRIATVEFLKDCAALEELSVVGCASLEDLSPLRGLRQLAFVDASLSGVRRVIQVLNACDSLRTLLVHSCVLDIESAEQLEARASRIASTHRAAYHINENASVAAAGKRRMAMSTPLEVM